MIVIHTAVANLEDAHKIAHALVAGKLVACAQISEMESIYTWKEAIQQQAEFRLSLKTTDENYTQVEAMIRQLHPYELPEIYAVPITQVFEPYADWVTENCGQFN